MAWAPGARRVRPSTFAKPMAYMVLSCQALALSGPAQLGPSEQFLAPSREFSCIATGSSPSSPEP